MDLRFSPEENAFRQELRSFFRSEVPETIRKKVSENRHLSKEEMVTSHKVLHAKGLTVPHWPKEWGGADWTPGAALHLHRGAAVQRRAAAAAVQRLHVRTGGHRLRHARAEEALPAAHGGARRLVVPGLLRARRRLRSRRPQDHGRAPGRPLRRQRPEDLDHAGAVRRLDLLPLPHRPGRQEAARHLVPADRHEDARHHRAPDPDHGRRPRGQRGVLRRRQGAGREPGRPGAPRLGLRQVPARQRAHRHCPRRLLQAARAAHQGAGIARDGRRQAADRGRALPREGGGRRGRAQGAGDDADARARRGPQPQGSACPIRSRRSSRSRAARSSRRPRTCCWRSPGRWRLPYQTDSDDAEFGSNEPPEDLEWAAPAAPAYFNYRKTTIYGGSNEIQRNILAKAVLGF